ncbi:UNVERIFIED_CONTAM: hypothetical protein FKN15_058311 [Acipenser sinensis]
MLQRKTWDPFLLMPFADQEEKTGKLFVFLYYVIIFIIGLLVLAFGFFSKSALMMLISVSSPDATTISNRPFSLLFLGCSLIVPNVLVFLKMLWKITFTDSSLPSKEVCGIELLVAFGTTVLTVVAMPHFDIITNIMILNSVCILPAVIQVINPTMDKMTKWLMLPPLLSIFLVLVGFVLFFVGYQMQRTTYGVVGNKDIYLYIGLAIGSTLLVSLNWWENFTSMIKSKRLDRIRLDLKDSRNMTYLISSVVRIVVTGIVVGQSWSSIRNVSSDKITIVLSLFAIQAISSALCHWFGVIACKMHAFRRGFALPTIFTTPAVFVAFLFMLGMRYNTVKGASGVGNFSLTMYCGELNSTLGNGVLVAEMLFRDVSYGLCSNIRVGDPNGVGMALLGISAISWWIGLVLSTLYVWLTNMTRLERTTELFVRRLYEAAFVDQSMLLNTRFHIWLSDIKTTETRLDRYRPKHRSQRDRLSLEGHIYFDDAFIEETNEQSGKKTLYANTHVELLVRVIEEVFRSFGSSKYSIFDEHKRLSDTGEQKIMSTPYGGRICYVLPNGNHLYIHLKDKLRIRHKKRWSQVMYLYYLLGWKLTRKYLIRQDSEDHKILEQQLKKEKQNTYILALDGDMNFQPSALMLLIDRLRMYPTVGAACGRIHPTGFGPTVWFQKFEYAVCHWFQKTAEHVFGCVLCSPGCFSLFRGAALMDDNVMKKYATKATEAAQYVQYDQGCFTFIFGLNGNISLFLAVLPPVFYMVICFTCKSDNQILVAGFMSIFYAFLIAATFLSIIAHRYHPCADSGGAKMNTRCPPKRVPSAARFFTHCELTVQPPQSYSVGGQRSSGQLTGKPAGARPDYRGRWCAIPEPEKNIQKKRKCFDGQLEYSGINCHGMD